MSRSAAFALAIPALLPLAATAQQGPYKILNTVKIG